MNGTTALSMNFEAIHASQRERERRGLDLVVGSFKTLEAVQTGMLTVETKRVYEIGDKGAVVLHKRGRELN